MKILKEKDLENCFEGSFIKEILFDSIVSKNFIHYMGHLGQLQYYPTFARPFYQIEVKDLFIIKGVEGNNTGRLILNKDNLDKSLNAFTKYVNAYQVDYL